MLSRVWQKLQRYTVTMGVRGNKHEPFTGCHTAAAAATATEPRQSLAVQDESSTHRRPVGCQVSYHGCCLIHVLSPNSTTPTFKLVVTHCCHLILVLLHCLSDFQAHHFFILVLLIISNRGIRECGDHGTP